MNKAELNQNLNFLADPQGELNIIVYAVLKGENEEEQQPPMRLDIAAKDLPDIREMFIQGLRTQVIESDHALIRLSTADERGNCFYEYDLEIPEELALLNEVVGNDSIEAFRFTDQDLANINSLIIVIADQQNRISLYKKLSPVEVIGRGGFIIKRANQRFERFNDKLLRISPRFQVLSINGTIIILDLKSIERSFGFIDVIQREAMVGLDSIRNMQILSNIETLEELIEDISFARKLTRIARNSPVIKSNIPNQNIIAFSRNHPALRGRIKYNDDQTQISLDTKVSKDLFVKLLNDDFLTSELTRLFYESLAKDGVMVVEEENESSE